MNPTRLALTLSALGFVGCASVASRGPGQAEQSLQAHDCRQFLAAADAAEVGAAPEAAQRLAARRAQCALEAGDPAGATLALARAGQGPQVELLRARVAAVQGDAAGAAEGLRRAGAGTSCRNAVLHAPEFERVWSDEAFFRVAVWCWFRDRDEQSAHPSAWNRVALPTSQEYFTALGEARHTPLVHPRVAAADPGGSAGRLVNAVGMVTGASLDRAGKQMLLRIEFDDVEVTQVASRTAVVGHHEDLRLSGAYLVPDTKEVNTYAETFTPSGLTLYVAAPLDEGLLSARYLQVVGRIADHPFDTQAVRPVGKAQKLDDSGGVVYVGGAYLSPRTPLSWER